LTRNLTIELKHARVTANGIIECLSGFRRLTFPAIADVT
jgi:hypothetical protein